MSTADAALDAIAARSAAWVASINDGDPDAFVSVVHPDAVWLPAGRTAVEGRERIRAWLQAPFATFSYTYSVDRISVRVMGDWAVERSRFRTEAVTADGAAAPTHEGVYIVLWRRTSEGWMIDRYIDLGHAQDR